MKTAVFCDDKKTATSLKKVASRMGECLVNPEQNEIGECSVAFVCGALNSLQTTLESLRAAAVYVVLVTDEDDQKSAQLFTSTPSPQDLIDDVLLMPLRPLELMSKLRHFSNLSRFKDVASASQGLKTIINKIEEDLSTARSIQKKFLPEKYVVPGFRISHKYLSGLKSGGDYFDVFQFDDRKHVGVLMSDCTGYGVSSALISVMLRMAFRFGKSDPESPSKILARIHEEVRPLMKVGEDLSVFYGILDRESLEMTYTSAGVVRLFAGTQCVTGVTAPLTRDERYKGADRSASFASGQRFMLTTDGFVDALGGEMQTLNVLKKRATEQTQDLINDLGHAARKSLKSREDMPLQDCSVIVFDIDEKIRPRLRLA